MRRIPLYIVLSFISLSAFAQKKGAVPDVAEEVAKAIANYDFDTAEDLLDSRIAALKKKRQPTEEEEEKLEQIGELQSKLEATERVVFVDSIVVDKENFLQQMKIGQESGKVYAARDYFKQEDTQDCTVFTNEMGNQIIYAAPDAKGSICLYMSYMIGGEWSEGQTLKGLDEEDKTQNYPFMMNDGATLYYAAINDAAGLGGYDIYMTRYDSDDHTFLAPENIGMPFNSPANDYMYVIDEFYNLGWFATDRNQPEGKVCIYTFIPNETRPIYAEGELEDEKLIAMARIASIKDTWTDKDAVNMAKQRLNELKTNTNSGHKLKEFELIINDKETYTAMSDFKTEEGKSQAKWWMESTKDYKKIIAELDALRDKYAKASSEGKQQLTQQIKDLETKAEEIYAAINTQVKAIRRAENSK